MNLQIFFEGSGRSGGGTPLLLALIFRRRGTFFVGIFDGSRSMFVTIVLIVVVVSGNSRASRWTHGILIMAVRSPFLSLRVLSILVRLLNRWRIGTRRWFLPRVLAVLPRRLTRLVTLVALFRFVQSLVFMPFMRMFLRVRQFGVRKTLLILGLSIVLRGGRRMIVVNLLSGRLVGVIFTMLLLRICFSMGAVLAVRRGGRRSRPTFRQWIARSLHFFSSRPLPLIFTLLVHFFWRRVTRRVVRLLKVLVVFRSWMKLGRLLLIVVRRLFVVLVFGGAKYNFPQWYNCCPIHFYLRHI